MLRPIAAFVVTTLFAHSPAGASDNVTPLPTRPLVELRDRIHSVLRDDSERRSLEAAVGLGLGRTRSGLIALEESARWLSGRSIEPESRIDGVLAFAERRLVDATLDYEDRATLLEVLDRHLLLLKTYHPMAVIRLLDRHGLWTADHLDYLIGGVHDPALRRSTYRTLIRLMPRASDLQRRQLAETLRDHAPGALDLRAMLDEFGTLGADQYATLVKSLQRDVCTPRSTSGDFWLARRIRLRAIERIQKRLIAKDAKTLAAVGKASNKPGDELGREFFRRLSAGELSFDWSENALRSEDPLGLRGSSSNVVDFADCARRMFSN